MGLKTVVDIVHCDLLLLLFFFPLDVFPHLSLVLGYLYDVFLQALDECIAELWAVLLHTFLLRVLPNCEHEREQHFVIRLLLWSICWGSFG